jgi:IS1 family transposase/transposase-like protein
MVLKEVECPFCGSTDVVKRGKSSNGKQRYECKNEDCDHSTFILEYSYLGCLPDIKDRILDMTVNASGIRDTARVLNICTATVINTLRSVEKDLESINRKALEKLTGNPPKVLIVKVEDAELDEMWSFVGKKSNQRWLWHAIDHKTGQILAYVFGRRKDEVFAKLNALLAPFGIKKYYTDDWGAYDRGLSSNEHIVGKRNTQKIERKHLTLRTRIKRLARKTICFSKINQIHDIVIGLFINRYEFGLAI